MTATTDSQTQGLAELISTALGPIPVGVAVSLTVGVAAGRGVLAGLGWGLLAIAIAAFLPAVVTRSLRRQERSRRQRLTYLAITAGSAVAGAAVLVLLDAPRHVVGLELAVAAGLVGTSIVNIWIAASNHVVGLAGGVIILTTYVDPKFAFLGVAIPALAWSRVSLGIHTKSQCVIGLAFCVPIVALTLYLTR